MDGSFYLHLEVSRMINATLVVFFSSSTRGFKACVSRHVLLYCYWTDTDNLFALFTFRYNPLCMLQVFTLSWKCFEYFVPCQGLRYFSVWVRSRLWLWHRII